MIGNNIILFTSLKKEGLREPTNMEHGITLPILGLVCKNNDDIKNSPHSLIDIPPLY